MILEESTVFDIDRCRLSTAEGRYRLRLFDLNFDTNLVFIVPSESLNSYSICSNLEFRIVRVYDYLVCTDLVGFPVIVFRVYLLLIHSYVQVRF